MPQSDSDEDDDVRPTLAPARVLSIDHGWPDRPDAMAVYSRSCWIGVHSRSVVPLQRFRRAARACA